MRLSLSRRFTLVFAVFGAVVAGAFQYHEVQLARRELYERQKVMGSATLGAIRALVAAQAGSGDYAALGRNLAEMIKGTDVAAIIVKDPKGKRIVARSSIAYAAREPHPGLPIQEVKDGFYDVETPVNLGPRGDGTIILGFETRQLEERLAKITAQGLTVGVMVFLAITLAAWSLGTWLALRIERIVPLLERLSGDPEKFRPLSIGAGMEDEVSRLLTAFNSLGASLKEERARRRALEQEKVELAAMLVHDLKTPLTVVHSGISLLQEQLADDEAQMRRRRGLTPNQRRRSDNGNRRTFTLLRMSSDRLQRMIEDVLQLSRMEEVAGLRETLPVNLATLVKACAKDFGIIVADRDQKLKVDIASDAPVMALGDHALLRRVLDNLVHNAVEHTPPEGEIRLGLARESEGRARLTVSDSGPGIPPEARGQIFQKFFQKDFKRYVGNVGLGLALCEKAVQRHGGAIGVTDAKPHGACFYIVLPATAAPAHEDNGGGSARGRSNGKGGKATPLVASEPAAPGEPVAPTEPAAEAA